MKTLIKLALICFSLALPVFAAGPFHAQTTEGMASSLITTGGKAADVSRISGKKYLFIYFSAHWCPPCRAFTPKLVQFYNEMAPSGDFELLFVSSDKNQAAMEGYMAETSMPWVALKYGSPRVNQLKEKYGVRGIPCLVLLDEKDQVLASSYEGNKYVGPAAAIKKFLSLK